MHSESRARIALAAFIVVLAAFAALGVVPVSAGMAPETLFEPSPPSSEFDGYVRKVGATGGRSYRKFHFRAA